MSNATLSKERREYLKKKKIRKTSVLFTQIFILAALIASWEILANLGVIDSFLMSQPSRIVKTFLNLSANDLPLHLWVTCYETLTGFLLGACGGTLLAVALWLSLIHI